MALCDTCSGFDLYQIFNSPEARLPTAVDSEQKLFWHEYLNRMCFRHSQGISPIQIAAAAGCGLCTLLFDAFKGKDSVAAQEVSDLPIILAPGATIEDEWNDPPRFSPYLEPKLRSFFLSPQEGLLKLCDLDISIDKASSSVPTELPFEPFSKIHDHPEDVGCMALASKWLSACLENHDCPSPNLTDPVLSIRFLKIEDGIRHPHLVEFPPGARLQPWAALSYRWGESEPPVKLVRDTEAYLKAGVAISSLGAAIQDAIAVCRGLEIQYLWVDVICIFQDQESDWLEQSSQMSYIYGQATVTVVSVDTNDASQHFLSRREAQSITIPWKGNANQSIHEERRNLPHVYVSSSWPDHQDQLIGPWSERAWTLQEGLLPNRILFYSAHQVAWKCCSAVQYERGHLHVPLVEFGLGIADEPGGRPFWQFDLFTKFKILEKYLESSECYSEHDRYRIWYHILEDYSARDMTYLRDRLVAISGIAKAYGKILQGEIYVAGLWQSDMIPGLLWYAKGLQIFGGKVNQSVDVENQIPSWSWASAPCGFSIRNDWADKSFRTLSVLENVSFSLEDLNNPFGGVLHAEITIRGPVYRFSRLYYSAWRSLPSELSAFERHLSRAIELDYGEKANDFSCEGCYFAMLLVQEFPSIDHRLDALILRSSPSQKNKKGIVLERLGILKLSFYSMSTSPSIIASTLEWEKSLKHRLDPGNGRRCSKRVFCMEFFEEYDKGRWPHESVTII